MYRQECEYSDKWTGK